MGTWFWSEHRTKAERKQLYNHLRKAGVSPAHASAIRDMQPYKIRGKIKNFIEPMATTKKLKNAVKRLKALPTVRGVPSKSVTKRNTYYSKGRR